MGDRHMELKTFLAVSWVFWEEDRFELECQERELLTQLVYETNLVKGM